MPTENLTAVEMAKHKAANEGDWKEFNTLAHNNIDPEDIGIR